MTTIKFTEARANLPSLVTQVITEGQRVIIERHGHERVALVPMADVEVLQRLEDAADVEAAEAALAESGNTVPWEKVKEDLAISKGYVIR